ncbi:MAG: isoleucine--tRNA ligase [Coriobacteriia bacterium]|nr:isoleucine--tRNA ligase [Coriobacteriia bacterium]
MSQDYKETMNLPQTEFPMRGNLPANEPLRLATWEEMDLYGLMLKRNEGKQPYVLHDGPPYANGPIHIGHSLNKILKDIIVKYKTLQGYYAPYVPGWDCHGQPIEHMVETMLGPEKMAQTSQPVLRRLCREWAEKYVDVQREGFKRLGILGEWDDPYLTYAHEYEAGNIEIFKKMYEAGAIYRGRKPIHWCHHCHTALAEAEIEYADEPSSSIYVAFELTEPAKVMEVFCKEKLTTEIDCCSCASGNCVDTASLDGSLHILIWTTTPWTLPANTGVTLSAEAEYVMLSYEGKWLIVARELASSVAKVIGDAEPVFMSDSNGNICSAKGADLFDAVYHHPIHDDMTGRVITGSHVELTTGTGAVHTAPGHGQEDYLMGVEFDLPLLMPVDDNGVFDMGGGPFEGLNVEDANPVITKWLYDKGTLVAQASIKHSYPHCWRCHKPVIFRATDQWFVSMEETSVREKAIAAIDVLNWYPNWAVNRMRGMLEGRPDWCISRQRSWGVPIPVFKCAKCSATVATPETFDAVIELFKREGADAWFTYAPSDYLPAKTACSVCGTTELIPEKDILDVWWESGVSHTSVLIKRPYLEFPADLYLEGSDQHRGWFQSALLTSIGAYGVAPYKGVMSCGFVVDGEGIKMSKSRGNVIDPAEVVGKFGADVLRLWVGSMDYSQDVGIDAQIIERTSDAYRRIRNTFRFLLSNLNDFSWNTDAVTWDELKPIDAWALVRLMRLTEKVTEAYNEFKFHVAFHAIYDYIVTDLSAIYLDVLKDRLYSDGAKSLGRRAAQTVLANILEALVRMLAPILTFTCDEVWGYYPAGIRMPDHAPAIMLAGWPTREDFSPAILPEKGQSIERDFELILTVREAVTKALEEARKTKVIGKSQEAALTITAEANVHRVLASQQSGMLEELFIVASVTLKEGLQGCDLEVEVQKAEGDKCPRCWNIRTLGEDGRYPELCSRCAAVLEELDAAKMCAQLNEAEVQSGLGTL